MNESLDEIERVFLALSDKTRIRLIGLMNGGEVSVNYLCESLGESQPKVSRHLAYLRGMGMVKTRRDGKWIYYSLSEPDSPLGSQLLRDTLSWIASISRGSSLPTNQPRTVPVVTSEFSGMTDEGEIYGYPDMYKDAEELEIYLL